MSRRGRARVVCGCDRSLRAFARLRDGVWSWLDLDLTIPDWLAEQLSPYMMTKALRRLTERQEEKIRADARDQVLATIRRASHAGVELLDAPSDTVSRFVDEAWAYYALTRVDRRVLEVASRRLRASYGRAWYEAMARIARGEDDGSAC